VAGLQELVAERPRPARGNGRDCITASLKTTELFEVRDGHRLHWRSPSLGVRAGAGTRKDSSRSRMTRACGSISRDRLAGQQVLAALERHPWFTWPRSAPPRTLPESLSDAPRPVGCQPLVRRRSTRPLPPLPPCSPLSNSSRAA